jgi:probable rRNA maturation factor
MLELEVFGSRLLADPLPPGRAERLCVLALASAGIEHGHIAIEFVDAMRISELNLKHRGKHGPTDVLSFPIDGVHDDATGWTDAGQHGRDEHGAGGHGMGEELREDLDVHEDVPYELGDIVICPEQTRDIPEAILHGALHLLGMDHETDEGQMLAVQAELLRWENA